MKPQKNQIRIIAGKWRGRKISFPDADGLRPTTDRIRETVFNWLMPYISGSDCLDLFAGSGALGFEAASRGAAQVDLVENSRPVLDSLTSNIDLLKATNVQLHFDDALSYLNNLNKLYNIIFIDPPFSSGLLQKVFQKISEHPVLKPGGLVYLEQPVDQEVEDLSDAWVILKEKHAGNVRYILAAFQPDDE